MRLDVLFTENLFWMEKREQKNPSFLPDQNKLSVIKSLIIKDRPKVLDDVGMIDHRELKLDGAIGHFPEPL
jgi:hypothetical protein